MISRVTLWLGMAALMIPLGIALWSAGHTDACSRFLAGDSTRPGSVMVETAGHMVEVPCSQWLPRQPQMVQRLCLVEAALVLVLGLNALGDVVDAKKAGVPLRRRRR